MRLAKNCLTCAYEPDWGDPVGVEFKRRIGQCKWNGPQFALPACYQKPIKHGIIRHSDNSGIHHNCPTWEPKE